ncbi:ATP-binding protein [Virgibacillus ainsalahensis]
MRYHKPEQKSKESDNLPDIDNKEIITDLSRLPTSVLTWIGNNVKDVFILWNQKGEAIFISESFQNLLGYKLSDYKTLTWHELLSPKDARYIHRNIDKNTNENQVFNVDILNSQGKYILSECTIVKLKDTNSDEFHYISLIKGISDRKELEEMMLRYEKMSVAGQLAAGIAHEIRNPLTSMKGFLQLLQAGVKGNEEYYNIMLDEIVKMETITSELLFISKPLTENMKMEPVDQMVNEVIVLLQTQAKLKNIDIEYDYTYNGLVFCDRSQIKQVLVNLMKNAIEAMEQPGTIKITAEIKEDQVELTVIDEGRGIPKEIIHKLGEPFFTTKQSGTGLGIMITKQILERHDAVLEVDSNKEKGSKFRIIFPRNNGL